MLVPTFKTISINSAEKRMIDAQLDQYEFGTYPYILTINEIIEGQLECLTNIEEYIEEKEITLIPYPIYIIGDIKNYKGKLEVFSSKKEIPRFYNQKERVLNSKEEQIFNKVQLKQRNLNSIQSIDFTPTLKEYARTHKKINELELELHYLAELSELLGETNE